RILVPADHVRIDAPSVGEVAGEELEADDVDHGVRRRHEECLAAELAERAHRVDRAFGGAAPTHEDEAAHRRIDRCEVAVEELLGVVRLRGNVRTLAELEYGL